MPIGYTFSTITVTDQVRKSIQMSNNTFIVNYLRFRLEFSQNREVTWLQL